MQHKLYIDGIRGIAVLAVIFFHANYELFQGGFLGVDIFFVLSGFLIIASIDKHIEIDKFSFLGYYKRRFLRIVPAALVVLLVVLIIGWMVMFPEELINLYKNIYYILTIKSNVLASESIDYFGIGVGFKPLVHYWSLSIEFQFYIFFPIFIYLFIKYKYDKILFFLLILILLSSISYATFASHISANEIYFSTFSRLWEFAFGALIFLILKKYEHNIRNSEIYLKYLPILGLTIIVISFEIFNNSYNVPGLKTLIPAFGVSLILLFAQDSIGIGKLLTFRPLVKIGIISYSLYLVHQPIFAFYRIMQDRNFYFYESIILIVITFILGYLLWRFVEKPFQTIQGRYANYKIIIFVVIIISLAILSYIQMNKKISDYTISNNIKKYLSFRYDNNPRLKECRIDNKIIVPSQACEYGDKSKFATIALWGDSHMDQIAMPLSNELNKLNYKTAEFSIAGCPPILGVNVLSKRRKCYENSKIVLNYIIHNKKYTDVVLFAYWIYYVKNGNLIDSNGNIINKRKLKKYFNDAIEKLHNAGKRIHIIYPTPRMPVNPPFHKARLEKIWRNNDVIIKLPQKEYVKQSSEAKELLDSVPENYNINKIYISELLKDGNFYIANNKNTVFYRDDNHLSTYGGGEKVSKYIAYQIKKFIDIQKKKLNNKGAN